MTDSDKSCPKCNRAMEVGFVADVGYGMILQSNWTAGIPAPRRFIGGIKWRQRDSFPITTYRCSGCGFLESYAAR
ncbi:MAG TPA: hypothetical protein VIM15_04435 [Gemmatimonadaceae bacterium]